MWRQGCKSCLRPHKVSFLKDNEQQINYTCHCILRPFFLLLGCLFPPSGRETSLWERVCVCAGGQVFPTHWLVGPEAEGTTTLALLLLETAAILTTGLVTGSTRSSTREPTERTAARDVGRQRSAPAPAAETTLLLPVTRSAPSSSPSVPSLLPPPLPGLSSRGHAMHLTGEYVSYSLSLSYPLSYHLHASPSSCPLMCASVRLELSFKKHLHVYFL